MFVLDVPFEIQVGQAPETIPIWNLSVEFYRDYFTIRVDRDWDRPHHVQAVCPWFHPHHPEWVQLEPNHEFNWKPTEDTRANSFGWFIPMEDLGEYQANKIYISKLHYMSNTTDHPVHFLAGQIELDPLAVPISVPESIQETGAEPDSFVSRAGSRTILAFSSNEWNEGMLSIYYHVNKKYHVVPVRLPVMAKKSLGVRIKNAWWLKDEENYVDEFEVKYQDKKIPEHLMISKIDHEAEWYQGSVICLLVTRLR